MSAGGQSTGPLQGESLGIPTGMRLPAANIWNLLLPIDARCEFGNVCVPLGNEYVTGVTGSGTPESPFTIRVYVWAGMHIAGDFWADEHGNNIRPAPREIQGMHPTNIEFLIVGGAMRPPSIYAGPYRSGGGGINVKDFPFKGNRIALDYNAWKQTGGKMLLHLDVKIQQLRIRLKHWRPW
jgi:hypothetical protein